ncbi:MAG: hypothetical protein H7Z40_02740 [Phycisphaerae bacterium]|nr:hypothetical protein [Gemmatimonadaceae bacterium]
MTLPQQAAFHRAALLLGLTTGDAVIAWADSIIARDDEQPSALLDLAMIPPHDLSELRHALEPIATRVDSPDMLRALFDIARRNLQNGERSSADTITVLSQARSFFKLPDDYSVAIQTLANDHMLAVAGLRGEVADVEAGVAAWLAQFEGAEDSFLQNGTH